MTKQDNVFAALLVIFGGFMLIPIGVALEGWAISLLWKWFVVSQYGLPAMSIPVACGIALIGGAITHQNTNCKEDDSGSKAVKTITYIIIRPLFLVFTGWIITFWL